MQQERDHFRDLTFSSWRRCLENTHCIDVDSAEFCAACGRVLALLETTTQKDPKPTPVAKRLGSGNGKLADDFIPVYLVRFKRQCDENGCWVYSGEVQQVLPWSYDKVEYDEASLAEWICSIHRNCPCGKAPEPAWILDCNPRWLPRTAVRNIISKFRQMFVGSDGSFIYWIDQLEAKYNNRKQEAGN